jgi:acyl-CoA thioesterase-2
MTTLFEILTLEEVAPDLFRGRNGSDGWRSVFGGQVLGQALAAASLTVGEDRPAHSLHAYFLRGGAFDQPIFYQVERERDGRRFSSRRVVASQNDRPIFTLSASFHAGEPGVERWEPMPDVPMPEDLPTIQDLIASAPGGSQMARAIQRPVELIEVRTVDGYIPLAPVPGPAAGMFWFRASDVSSGSPALDRAALAYASDLFLLSVLIRPHRDTIASGDTTSLDHALWFHEGFRADEWMLYVQSSARSGHGRGMAGGRIYTRDGRHVATVVQEGLIRSPKRDAA